MTEAEWLKCDDPVELLNTAEPVSQRKGKLLVVGSCRQHPSVLSNRLNRNAILAIEQYVDGQISSDQLYSQRGRGKIGYRIATACSVVVPYQIFVSLSIYITDDREHDRLVAVNLIRDIFGNPFRPVTVEPRWRTETVVALATGIYSERAFDRMPILADALEEAGCDNSEILTHCRGDGTHVRGCWVVDLILGKE